MMFVPLLLVILLGYLVLHGGEGTRGHVSKTHERSALDILKKRYAEGTLSQEEFLRMKEELSKEE
ncbi:SHOCT domain-containing protein [Sphaerochaeta sp. PS]|uniref:SHOCT domain-containing protein n=1 Tax=Sphaerochaeta sp. PS TaxID=3076336 RepID=UPI0028A45C44|nr:SHOCT domain-containing protein [Sphaerochaeta sp. PS]MDT4761544.1 SHOCT domain-containing protein [Sphaerochaeta sp. PS]